MSLLFSTVTVTPKQGAAVCFWEARGHHATGTPWRGLLPGCVRPGTANAAG